MYCGSFFFICFVFFFQAEDGIRDIGVTGVQTCALPISRVVPPPRSRRIRRSVRPVAWCGLAAMVDSMNERFLRLRVAHGPGSRRRTPGYSIRHPGTCVGRVRACTLYMRHRRGDHSCSDCMLVLGASKATWSSHRRCSGLHVVVVGPCRWPRSRRRRRYSPEARVVLVEMS